MNHYNIVNDRYHERDSAVGVYSSEILPIQVSQISPHREVRTAG